MKKILIAAVAIASAFAAQAASFTWGGECLSSSANVDYEGYANEGTVYGIYLLSGLVTSDKITGYNSESGALTIDGATATLLKTHTLTSSEWDNGVFAAKDAEAVTGNADDLNGKYYAIVMYDATADADKFSAEVYTITGLSDLGVPGNIDIQSGALSGNGLGSSLHGTVAVPEPTSGLLMLVGLGALALRRRRA